MRRDPVNSGFIQGLGAEMREAGIEAFEYHSSRSAEDVVQVGVISCCVFTATPNAPLPRGQHGAPRAAAAVRGEWRAAPAPALMGAITIEATCTSASDQLKALMDRVVA
jgi:hypothetical protein